ncbi:hypothetical protein GCM10022226_68570 [Sphaerisporangium flaviroseum]|uniref:Uncharacterized protein n=1 Tax=Sphaerisporangium flaviroseum TaxID=509199 RepID=A0ABP7J7H8_9ACTN
MSGSPDEVALVESEEDFIVRARSWTHGRPFPLLNGPSVERYRDRLRRRGRHRWPAADTRPRDGVVLSVGGQANTAAGALLAGATSRPHSHVGLGELAEVVGRHAGEPIALVGLVDDFAPLGDWPGHLAPRLGVVTARDASSLSCLVYRTLTLPALDAARDWVINHPDDEEADSADAVGWDELGSLTDEPLRVLAMRTHGMECSANLPDAILCGRSDYLRPPLPLLEERRAVSCLRGAGCYRKDLKEEQRIAACDIDANVVITQTCMSVAVGNNVFPGEIGFGVGFLAGTAVAVVGTIGKHLEDAGYMHQMRDGLDAGRPIGETLERVNRQARLVGGEMSRLGLLGDPTLVLKPPEERVTPRPARRWSPRQDDGRVLRRLSYVNGTVVPRLLRLRWLDVDVPEGDVSELRGAIRNATGARRGVPPADELAVVTERLAAIQAEVARRIVEQIHSSWWHFTQEALPAFGKAGDEPARCPRCGVDSAFRARFAHRVEPELVISTVQCRRCGDLGWSTDDSTADLETDHVVWLRRGQARTMRATLSNRQARRLTGAVGFAISAGAFLHLDKGWSAECDLGSGGSRELSWTVEVSSQVVPHEYEGWCVRLLDGIYSASTVQMEVLP